MLLPAVATVALGTALLVPLRDDRQGRRATFARGKTPLRPQFHTDGEQTSGPPRTHGQNPSLLPAGSPSDAAALLDGPPHTIGTLPSALVSSSSSLEGVPLAIEGVPQSFVSAPLSVGSVSLSVESVPPLVDRLHRATREETEPSAIGCREATEGVARLDVRWDGPLNAAPEVQHDVAPDIDDPAATTHAALLEPFALISAVARPLIFLARPLIILRGPLSVLTRPLNALRAACIRLITFELAKEEKQDGEAPSLLAADGVVAKVVERSFAAELSALLGQPPSPVPDTHRVLAPEDRSDLLAQVNTAGSKSAGFGICESWPEVSEPASSADLQSAAAERLQRTFNKYVPSTSTEDARSASNEDVPSASPDNVRSPSPADVPSASADPIEAAGNEALVVAAQAVRSDRVVPLTRLPLRPQGIAITWTDGLAEFAGSGVPSRAERHALLERAVRDGALLSGAVADLAYHQEDGACRTLALRIMLRHFPQPGRAIFIDALRVGSDEERAIAIDGLATVGARDELARGVADRVEAIAAKAALAYVGTLNRADYRVELSALIDATQIESILKLLAGIVE